MIELSNYSMCAYTSTYYYVKRSHFVRLEICLEFVANRLGVFVESQHASR